MAKENPTEMLARDWRKNPAEMIAEMIAGRLPQNFPAEMIARKNDRELF